MTGFQLYERLKGTIAPEAAEALAGAFEELALEVRNAVTKEDFRELKEIVADLGAAQKRTEQRLDSLAAKVEELAEAQKRTEQRVEELAEAQKRTEQRLDSLAAKVEELAEAQKRTEQRVEELAEAQMHTEQRLDSLAAKVEELAEAQMHTEQRLDSLAAKVEELAEAQKRTEQRVEELAEAQKELAAALKQTEQSLSKKIDDLDRRFGTLGSRWGEDAEGAFRQGLLEHVRELGYTVEHYHGYDPEGFINWTPRSYDLDILTSNGKVIATEIKSFTTAGDVTEFWRSVELFVKQTGREVSRRILVAVTIQKSALKRAEELGVTVSTHFPGLSES